MFSSALEQLFYHLLVSPRIPTFLFYLVPARDQYPCENVRPNRRWWHVLSAKLRQGFYISASYYMAISIFVKFNALGGSRCGHGFKGQIAFCQNSLIGNPSACLSASKKKKGLYEGCVSLHSFRSEGLTTLSECNSRTHNLTMRTRMGRNGDRRNK